APTEGYFRYFPATDSSSATAILYNADGYEEGGRLLFLINPEDLPIHFDLSDLQERGAFRLVTDGEQFFPTERVEKVGERHPLGSASCQLWASP
ncbi:MAG: hypothetical protein LBF24_01650, partial [Puniceicoccales bacterium]|nr:hypothetical protein [Puniceicoccales bacterium]